MSEILNKAIACVQASSIAFYRYITANDTGTTGAHQAGFYIPKCASALLFDTPGNKGENKDRTVEIRWQDEFTCSNRFIYYGKHTRNEYRITRFGRRFPFFEDDNIGDLLIIAKNAEEEYSGYVLHTDDDIESFFSYFNLPPNGNNQLIQTVPHDEQDIERLYRSFIAQYEEFPQTHILAQGARDCYNVANRISQEMQITNPDSLLLEWINSEFALFKRFEEKCYADILAVRFPNLDEFIKTANEVLNRRKSRAGKSLEHHLATIFTTNHLVFEQQAITEDNKKPDFLFPNRDCYHNFEFPVDGITVLGAKTTCKDRWRQIMSEADRVDTKYLFTLQRGVSRNQMNEMRAAHVQLVVPSEHIDCFPADYKTTLYDLKRFIAMIKEKQATIARPYLTNIINPAH